MLKETMITAGYNWCLEEMTEFCASGSDVAGQIDALLDLIGAATVTLACYDDADVRKAIDSYFATQRQRGRDCDASFSHFIAYLSILSEQGRLGVERRIARERAIRDAIAATPPPSWRWPLPGLE